MSSSTALTDEVVLDDPREASSPATRGPSLRAVPETHGRQHQSLREIWDDYKSTGSPPWDLLVLEYAPYAKRVAEHLGKRVPPNSTNPTW